MSIYIPFDGNISKEEFKCIRKAHLVELRENKIDIIYKLYRNRVELKP